MNMNKVFRYLLLATTLFATLALTACGDESAESNEAAREGVWVPVGNLHYQVQISRQLNPKDPEDGPYLQGVPADQLDLPGNQAYFAVFLRAMNTTDKYQKTASDFEIEDTQHKVYKPIALAKTNVFAYKSTSIKGDGGVYPIPNSPAANGPTNGGILVFKVTMASFQNRPLEFKIKQGGKEAVTDLDV